MIDHRSALDSVLCCLSSVRFLCFDSSDKDRHLFPSFYIIHWPVGEGKKTPPSVPKRGEESSESLETMYPRVKVRDRADHVAVQEDATSYILRVIETLSIEDHRSPKVLVSSQANERRNDLQSSHARIAKSHPRNSPIPTVSTSKGKGNKSIDEDNRTNIRASPVPRPRAVLSSPDNDGIIGSQNQSRERAALRKHTPNNDGKIGKQNQQIEEETLPKRQTPSRIALVQGKPTSRRVELESPLPVRAARVSRDAANSSQPKDRQKLQKQQHQG